MKDLGTFDSAEARRKVLADVRKLVLAIRKVIARPRRSIDANIDMLRALRTEIYESLNQIQHEHMILEAAKWLVDNKCCPRKTIWTWNPRQSGTKKEPDLRGTHNRKVHVSAEITTSEKPVGTIEKRMATTLRKLSTMSGTKFYFVRTPSMARRAKTKVKKGGWQINVEELSVLKVTIDPLGLKSRSSKRRASGGKR